MRHQLDADTSSAITPIRISPIHHSLTPPRKKSAYRYRDKNIIFFNYRMFPEDININILSFLGIYPRHRCWNTTKKFSRRCRKNVKNINCNLLCPLHDKIRFKLPLYKPFEEIIYLSLQTKAHNPKYSHRPPIILQCPPPPINIVMGYPNFPYV